MQAAGSKDIPLRSVFPERFRCAAGQENQSAYMNQEKEQKDVSKLPAEYLAGMAELLGDEYPAFLATYEKPPVRGLRFRTGKARPETIAALKSAWRLNPVAWCAEGFRYSEEQADGSVLRPGKSPYHDAGVYYIQEPSAMLPAASARLTGREAVLDLCAAPGGKSTQAAVGAGFLVSNEYVPKRARILSSNLERMGITNALVTTADSQRLLEAFPCFFDRILVDAPCSGEGMMRRDEMAIAEWSVENVARCVLRQREILENAAGMLRDGGLLIYSTCTFEPAENGWQLRRFLHLHPEFRLCSEEQLFPHKAEGEGHYCAVLQKQESGGSQSQAPNAELLPAYFAQDMPSEAEVERALQEAKARCAAAHVSVLRCGLVQGSWMTGKVKGARRYEPSHAEILAGKGPASRARLNLKQEALALRYLRGEALNLSDLAAEDFALSNPEQTADGFLTVCYDGYPLGAGKLVGQTVKNHYPKGLRHLT